MADHLPRPHTLLLLNHPVTLRSCIYGGLSSDSWLVPSSQGTQVRWYSSLIRAHVYDASSAHLYSDLPDPRRQAIIYVLSEMQKLYLRRQEVKPHLMSVHLPDWIGCPYPDCPWRGDHTEEFNKHLSKEHGYNLSNLERSQYEIYDREHILHPILDEQQPRGRDGV